MEVPKPVILITGATGKQGGAVISALQQAKALTRYDLLAVTRRADSLPATRLQDQGMKVLEADLDDVPSMFESATRMLQNSHQTIWGVFSVQNPIGPNASVEKERRQGKALVNEALANDVKFFVYSSVDRGGEDQSYRVETKVPHFASKFDIERHLVAEAQGKMDWVILRPATFMETLGPDFIGKIMATSWKSVVCTRPLQMVSVRDIGWFAAQAFERPEEYSGRAVSLAGDALYFAEANDIFRSVVDMDMPLTFSFVNKGVLWVSKELGSMFDWFETDGCQADIDALKRMHPQMLSFREWLEQHSQWLRQ